MTRIGLALLLLLLLALALPLPHFAAGTQESADTGNAGAAADEDDAGEADEAGDTADAAGNDEEEEEENPHLMVLPDGTKDMDKCGYCHTDDNKTLERSPEDTCTNCHDVATHGGSLSHSQATPEEVKAHLASPGPGEKQFPLTEKGTIYCATCHLSHDAAGLVDGLKWLPTGCEESTTPFSVGVREALDQYRDRIASPKVAHFAKDGTRLLRLPACDGQLCAHCHGELR